MHTMAPWPRAADHSFCSRLDIPRTRPVRMGRRSRHAVLDRWRGRRLELPDGDALRWLVVDDPTRPASAEVFRRDSPDDSNRGGHSVA